MGGYGYLYVFISITILKQEKMLFFSKIYFVIITTIFDLTLTSLKGLTIK